MTPQIIPIFPAAIYRINLRKLSVTERTAFDTNTVTAISRQGNQTSVNSSLLQKSKQFPTNTSRAGQCVTLAKRRF